MHLAVVSSTHWGNEKKVSTSRFMLFKIKKSIENPGLSEIESNVSIRRWTKKSRVLGKILKNLCRRGWHRSSRDMKIRFVSWLVSLSASSITIPEHFLKMGSLQFWSVLRKAELGTNWILYRHGKDLSKSPMWYFRYCRHVLEAMTYSDNIVVNCYIILLLIEYIM